ncbi:MAG: right-handed parallel beta-helix repeat-containing protein, partial [Clostridia bacterium]|nr:right-handed parallel beta-helix repeat-containing protein [Clostridia bacterium]
MAVVVMVFGSACKSGKESNEKKITELTVGENELVLYVATSGNDQNDGTFQKPFATVEAARNAVRTLDKSQYKKITVAIEPGDYRVKSLQFTSEDSGTAECCVVYGSYWDEPAVINGGVTIRPSDFSEVTDKAMKSRLQKSAQSQVVCTDLKKLGLTEKDWGKLYAIGTYSTADKYDGDYVGDLYCELFVNDQRMTMARYPNGDEWLYSGEVLEWGEAGELNHDNVPGWDELRNPKPDVYEVDEELVDRISKWATLDDVWMFGYPGQDWADASSPIGSFDAEAMTLSPKFVSRYEAKGYAPYYFYNVFEELDAPGEWYLDRKNGVLYMYKPENMKEAVIDLSLTTEAVISCEETNYITFENLTVKGTRGRGMSLVGDNNTVKGCTVKNTADLGIYIEGLKSRVTECEVCHTGKGGVELLGGNGITLDPGEDVCDNCYIHDWAEIYQTYQAAVRLRGVGNTCSHNEMKNAPHLAVVWYGNNHVIEYNDISNVCRLSDDAGALYAGKSWVNYGNEIRYNYIHDIGSEAHSPSAIYLDDAESGHTVYGNVLVNIPANALFLGGGRDLDVRNNVIINAGQAISYDQRAIDGFLGDWFTGSKKDAVMWQTLKNTPYTEGKWKELFPQMQKFNLDYNAVDDPNFPPNPAGSVVTENLIIDDDLNIGMISPKVEQFSRVADNPIYTSEFLTDL